MLKKGVSILTRKYLIKRMHELEFTAKAKNQIDNLPTQKIRGQIRESVLRLAVHPTLGKRLQGDLGDLWSYRSGNYRIIYRIFHTEVKILIVELGDRKDVYKRP